MEIPQRGSRGARVLWGSPLMKLVQRLMKGLAKNPDKIWLEVGNREFKAAAELLKGKEREDALARIAATAPRYGEYQKKTDREIPVIRLTPAL